MITYGAIKSGEQMVRVGGDVRDLDIHLPDIRPDQSAQPRENLHNDRIAEYAESMKAGDRFPPLTVFHDGEVYWLADGFHRFYAAQHAGRKHIRCYVRQGGLRDAILYSVGANAKHGLARSQADKERAVLRLLNDEEWGQWSDREIAKRCHVDHKTVARIRKDASGEIPQIQRKVQRGGTVYTQKVAKPADARKSRVTEGGDEETKSSLPVHAAQGFAGDDAAEKAKTGSHPSLPRNIREEFIALWSEAGSEDRHGIIAYLRTIGFRIEVTAGGTDVDRSAERASSAVEVGATNSPDGADETRGGLPVAAASGTAEETGRTPAYTRTGRSGTPPVAGVTAGETASNSQSAIPTAEEAAAETPMAPRPSAAANPSIALSRVEQVLLIRPHCQHPGTDECGGSGRNHCHACKRLMAESEAA